MATAEHAQYKKDSLAKDRPNTYNQLASLGKLEKTVQRINSKPKKTWRAIKRVLTPSAIKLWLLAQRLN